MNTTVVVTTLIYLAVTAGLGYLGYIQTTSAKREATQNAVDLAVRMVADQLGQKF